MRIFTRALVVALVLAVAACAPEYSDDRFVGIARALHPSVVLLSMHVPPEHKSDRYDDAYATGTIIATGPWGSDILTVAHAVEGSWGMHVTIDNRAKVPARVIALDKDLDVALVRTTRTGLVSAELGSSRDLESQLGRNVALLGYPIPDEFAYEELGLATSIITGRLSSVRKDALEVTLPIVPGESGGPIFLMDTGEIVGIAESRFDDEHSIGFALPIDDAKRFLHRVDGAHGF
ncbi:MAG TPA: serine protease [Candidatus Baltobacteraceae bacterium]|nr:serine protease [Candidatus Baltobacteraceae bacterium]